MMFGNKILEPKNKYTYIILVKSKKCYLLQVLKVYSKQIIDKTCLWL